MLDFISRVLDHALTSDDVAHMVYVLTFIVVVGLIVLSLVKS
jgi:hypothetical protein